MRSDTSIDAGSTRYLTSLIAQGLLIAAVSWGLFWLVWIYGNGLRDPRYLDGWVLAGGMSVQLYFHIAIKRATLSPKSAIRWRKIHIFLGYLLIAAFLSHSDFSLPDTGFEWALWAGFVLVTLSGIFGAYLAWSLTSKGRIDSGITYDRIPGLRAELARNLHTAVSESDPAAAQLPLPGLPHNAWIIDLYTAHLRDFFNGPRNLTAHLIGSQRPLKRLTDEIDILSRYVDQPSQEKLAAIKSLVVEKDRLDFARVHLGLSKAWLFVHVPVTYALIVLTVLHVIVAYAFSAGAW
ncbi:hypothetical protein [Hyphomicrobium sp.]|uniref:hypothetical protein n=1 Tax=Hyphomicrobium sp. TaxID=82 RepID=UPI002E2F3E68|nr:hypothetical protein [Hyphomicrobium sp.]HEX2841687.1 hypothetical protein [Hyphomicrobium sp.]